MRRTVVPDSLARLARHQAGLVTTVQARTHGINADSLTALVRHRRWTRVCRGVYDVRLPDGDAWTGPGTPSTATALGSPTWVASRRRLRAVWTALLAYGPGAVAVGRCALVLHGVAGLPATIPSEAALPRASNRRDMEGVSLRQFDDGMRTVTVGGRRTAALDWALAQAVPELPRRNGLAVLDSVLHQGTLSRREVEATHDLARGRRGIASRHDLFELADGRAESPLESFARLECVDGGVEPDTLQLPLADHRGGRRARGDLAWRLPRGRHLVVEMDGSEFHSAPEAVRADRLRQNRIVSTGRVDVLRYGYEVLDVLAQEVRSFLNRAR
ncbi:type IV toxin-antitoxin system AbiEi family antitoxin domain-containing protein [Isoptericola sp. BMS4]|uniref:type IV toxin-antitoxin system AbiEi family antitoxin domain-containing protein n=1 Tax=Isoptericola sp. BMS4 TaxID=2527875 RepID=UPI001420138D|nr:type IV toxin-antitoxin system AbiEi family antitoxin domain-containing protein [Isoptericola sp. BMS4]